MRNKVSREVKAEACRLYMDGLSLRVIARKFHVSKESVRQWILKFEEAFAKKKLARKKERDVILLDETKVKRNGKMAYVTICLDLERREVVSSLASRSISSLSTINVVKQALKSCRNIPVVVTDHAPWYKYAFQSLGCATSRGRLVLETTSKGGIEHSNNERDVSSTTFQSEIHQGQSSELIGSYIYSHIGITTCDLMRHSNVLHQPYLDAINPQIQIYK